MCTLQLTATVIVMVVAKSRNVFIKTAPAHTTTALVDELIASDNKMAASNAAARPNSQTIINC